MGLSSIFKKFSKELHWALVQQTGIPSVSNIIDDFIFIHASFESCQFIKHSFIDMCQDLSVPIKHSKSIGPTRVMEAHGVLIDSHLMQLRLLGDKLSTCSLLLS